MTKERERSFFRRQFARHMSKQVYFKNLHPTINPTGQSTKVLDWKNNTDVLLNKFKRRNYIRTKLAEEASIPEPRAKSEEEQRMDVVKPLIRSMSQMYLLQQGGKILPSQLHQVFERNEIGHLAPDFTDENGRKIPLAEADDMFMKELNKSRLSDFGKKEAREAFMKNLEDNDFDAGASNQLWEQLGEARDKYHSLPDGLKIGLLKGQEIFSDAYENYQEKGNAEGEYNNHIDTLHAKLDRNIELEEDNLRGNDPIAKQRAAVLLPQLKKHKANLTDVAQNELADLSFMLYPPRRELVPEEADEKLAEAPPSEMGTRSDATDSQSFEVGRTIVGTDASETPTLPSTTPTETSYTAVAPQQSVLQLEPNQRSRILEDQQRRQEAVALASTASTDIAPPSLPDIAEAAPAPAAELPISPAPPRPKPERRRSVEVDLETTTSSPSISSRALGADVNVQFVAVGKAGVNWEDAVSGPAKRAVKAIANYEELLGLIDDLPKKTKTAVGAIFMANARDARGQPVPLKKTTAERVLFRMWKKHRDDADD